VDSFTVVAISIFAVLIFKLISHCGFGDVKLILVVVNLLIQIEELGHYLLTVSLLALFHVTIHLIATRDKSSYIPFAPALCGAVLAVRLIPS
jgi:prepilin signal peptidase PulO-like enzyme (type II secretory pathway)